jgi:hypothetical protein
MIALLLLALFGQAALQQHPSTTVANSSSSSDIGKIAEISYQMGKSLANLPSDMQRIAPCQFKAEARDFSPGMLRQIQARMETVLRESGRTVVAAPELKTLRIVSTDTSFRVSNTAPDLEEMAKLADRLRADGFLEGICSKSDDGDLMVSLRIFRARGGEVVWSDNFVAGPNKSERTPLDLDFSASVPFRLFPVSSFSDKTATYGNVYLLSNVSLEATVTENITLDKRFQVSMSLGYSHLSLYGDGVPDAVYHPDIHMGSAGLELLGVFFRKPNPDMGYWLGAYVGYEQFLPILYREPLGAFRFGYRSKLSRHFSISGGVMVMPFQNKMTGIISNDGQKFNLEKIGYEIAFLHYTL